MKKQINPSIKAHLLWSALTLLSLLTICAMPFALAQRNAGKPSVIERAAQPAPSVTAGPWETAYQLANGVHDVTSPLLLVFMVTNTNDLGPGSLRQAILDSNANPPPPPGTTNLITFNIPGSGVHTIMPATQLPDIIQPLMIDGYTQPGSSPNTMAVGNNARLTANISAAPRPWTARAPIRKPIEGEAAAAAELTVNTVTPTAKSLRRP